MGILNIRPKVPQHTLFALFEQRPLQQVCAKKLVFDLEFGASKPCPKMSATPSGHDSVAFRFLEVIFRNQGENVHSWNLVLMQDLVPSRMIGLERRTSPPPWPGHPSSSQEIRLEEIFILTFSALNHDLEVQTTLFSPFQPDCCLTIVHSVSTSNRSST